MSTTPTGVTNTRFTWGWLSASEADQASGFVALAVDLGSDATLYVDDTGGSWGGATVEILGSLTKDGAFYQLRDPQGNTISFNATDDAIGTIQENVNYIKPQITGGSSVDLDIYVKVGGTQ